MSDTPHKIVSDENWSQLMTLAAGYLSLEEGDIQASMARALKAHADLIRAIKKGEISAELPGGRVTMFVPDEGGVALRTERPESASESTPAPAAEATPAPEQVAEPEAQPTAVESQQALDDMIDAPTEIEEQPTALPGIDPTVPAGVPDPSQGRS